MQRVAEPNPSKTILHSNQLHYKVDQAETQICEKMREKQTL